MRRSNPSRKLRIARWLLVASFVLPQTTCTIEGPPGSSFVIDPAAAIIFADLVRDVVFLQNADEDFFEDVADHDHDHFFDWWY